MTTKIEYAKPRGTYWSILSDGKFRTPVDEGAEGAVRREYETSDGKKGVKHELVAEAILGKITNLTFYDGDFGKLLQITLGDEPDSIIISVPVQSSFAEDFMKKLPNLNLEKDVRFFPYSFEDDRGKKRKGLTLYQGDDLKTKITDYYHKGEGKETKAINGYPEVPKESKDWDSEDWKIYFAQARKFLTGEVEKHPYYNKATLVSSDKGYEYPKEEINPDDITFDQ